MSQIGDVSLRAGCMCTWHTVSMNMISEIIKNLTVWPNYPSSLFRFRAVSEMEREEEEEGKKEEDPLYGRLSLIWNQL